MLTKKSSDIILQKVQIADRKKEKWKNRHSLESNKKPAQKESYKSTQINNNNNHNNML